MRGSKTDKLCCKDVALQLRLAFARLHLLRLCGDFVRGFFRPLAADGAGRLGGDHAVHEVRTCMEGRHAWA